MDIELNTLLVALMFVTILSMGIGNILVGLADIFNHTTASRQDRVHIAWIVLLLIVHLNMFWHTKALLEVEGWQFPGFLMTIAGPALMFFATSILLTPPPDDEADLVSFFVGLGRRFFLMFAVLQAWIVLVSYTMTGTVQINDYFNIALMVLAIVLGLNASPRVQTAGIWTAWFLGLASIAVKWTGTAT